MKEISGIFYQHLLKMNNMNPILVYCSWNCIYCIMCKRKDLKYGLDHKIGFESNILIKDNNTFLIQSNKICKLLQEYIIDQLVHTNVFRNYFVEYQEQKAREEEIESIYELIPCLVSTSGGINDHRKLFSEDNNCDNGFLNIIGNRICDGVFHDLAIATYSLNLQFYQFMFHFCIYSYCYSFRKRGMSIEQEYYLRQYFNYKDNIFPNMTQLKEFNYLHYSYADGILLHCGSANKNKDLHNIDFAAKMHGKRNDNNNSDANTNNLDVGDAGNIHQFNTFKKVYALPTEQITLVILEFEDILGAKMTSAHKTAKHIASTDKSKMLLIFGGVERLEEWHPINSKRSETKAKKEERKNKIRKEISNIGGIEEASDLLFKSIMFLQHFLKILGLNVNHNIENIKHERLIKNTNTRFENEILLPYYNDECYCNFDSFLGLASKNVNNFKVTHIMDLLLYCILCLLNRKMMLSCDILMICFEYCYTRVNINNNKLLEKFKNTLLNCVDECVSLRQDSIDNDIVSLKSSKQIDCINSRIDTYNKEEDNCDPFSSKYVNQIFGQNYVMRQQKFVHLVTLQIILLDIKQWNWQNIIRFMQF